ncbi:hypothetical protein [Vreelandella songnenensis]|uniref:hypothetical protein n=1 Tax=Vreelandella songnenensis TaxID=1176243 RepID=UPI0011B29251|nr:hypothetical protein [Halomonas songnenensis]
MVINSLLKGEGPGRLFNICIGVVKSAFYTTQRRQFQPALAQGPPRHRISLSRSPKPLGEVTSVTLRGVFFVACAFFKHFSGGLAILLVTGVFN